jgi:DNA-directed DNA polymerase III PolC
MYVHLTTHSAYSLQEGLSLPAELAQAAQADGMHAIGLTDHRLLTGSVEFVQACRQAGIQPLLGLEVDLEIGKLALLATSEAGWSTLCRLSSALAMRDDPAAACPFDLLAFFTNDLIALENWDSGHAQMDTLKTLFPGHLYVSFQDPEFGLPASALARRMKLPLVVTHPVYYLVPEQAQLQHTLTAIRLNLPLEQVEPGEMAPQGACFVSSVEMEARFWHFPGALAATAEIAERCRFDFTLGKAHMPNVPLPPGQTAAGYLRQKAETGACRLYGSMTPELQSRLDHELGVISHMGFEPIFLIVEDILNFARQMNIPFSSRGSAASSLVAHCLGITSPDPLQLNLYFERFLNPARSTPPDIDTDLCSRQRDSVIKHVFDTYGQDRVAMVATINRFRPRSALGDVAKAHGLEKGQIREIVKQLPYGFWARFEESEEGIERPSPFADLRQAYSSPKHQQILSEAEALLKLPRHLSVHAGGLIVAPAVVTDLAPIMRSGNKGVTITQLDLDSVEALGLVKIDLLGIRGLTVLSDVARFIHESRPHQSSSPLAILDSIPTDDPQTSQRVESGQTIGCFQIESPGLRATLREIHARNVGDIMAALALYRPGPLSGGLKDAFVRRFKGQEPVQHLHPALEPLLNETFGVILYQEQVLRIAHELAGFSLAEADLLRRAMSHFDPGKRMQELERKFVSEAQARNGVPVEIGERVWEMMAAFAGYGFPKAHAASYAQVAWRSAWCKTHFPAEFMAAVLANWGGYYSQRVYFGEARRLGLVICPPHVNHSGRNFKVESSPQALFMGLDQVKNLTHRTIERIIRFRPYHSLEDFLTRADPRPQEAVSLAQVGALEGLGNIPTLLRRLQGGLWQAGQMSLFAWDELESEDWSIEQKSTAQQALLGINLQADPLAMAGNKLAAAGAITTLEAAERIGKRVTVAGVRQTSHHSKTSKGESMLFLTIEDHSGMLDVILFPNAYRQARHIINSNAPMLLTGMMEMDAARGGPFLRGEKVTSLD